MLNHIHLIIQSPDCAGFVRDFKKYTSKRLKENIAENEPNVLKLFINEEGSYQFWGKTNMPLIVETQAFLSQKLQYLQNNPVKKQYVSAPENWYWSSANPGCVLKPNTVG